MILAKGWIQHGLTGLISEEPSNQGQRSTRTGASTLLTSSVALCPISRSIYLLSPSSTAERSCLLSTSVIEGDVFVKLDPTEDADSGDCDGVKVDIDHLESIVYWRLGREMFSSSESRRLWGLSCSAVPRLTRRNVSMPIILVFQFKRVSLCIVFLELMTHSPVKGPLQVLECTESMIQLVTEYFQLRLSVDLLSRMSFEAGHCALAFLNFFCRICHNLFNPILIFLAE